MLNIMRVTNSNNPAPETATDKDHASGANGEMVMVQCDGFRCLAYRDIDGKWKDAFHHKELKVLQVIAS